MAKQMVLNRKMYKEIKKMDHQDMSNYLSRYYMNAYNQGKEDSEGLKADELRDQQRQRTLWKQLEKPLQKRGEGDVAARSRMRWQVLY